MTKMVYQSFMIEIKIHRMVQRFRERKRVRDLNKKKKAKVQKDQAMMHINDNEKLAVEELALSMKGQLKWTCRTIGQNEDPDVIVNKARSMKFDSSYFSFINELLIWKKDINSSDQQGRVYLVQIDKIGVGMGDEFYFVRSDYSLILRQLET